MSKFKIPMIEKYSWGLERELSEEQIQEFKNSSIISSDTKVVKTVLRNLKNKDYTSKSVKRILSIILDNKSILDKTVLVNDGSYFNANIFIQPTKQCHIMLRKYGFDCIGIDYFNAKLSEMDKLNIIVEHCETLTINISKRDCLRGELGIDYDGYPKPYQYYTQINTHEDNQLRRQIIGLPLLAAHDMLFGKTILSNTKKSYSIATSLQDGDIDDK